MCWNQAWKWFITTSEAVWFWLKSLIRLFVKANFHNFWAAKVSVPTFSSAQQFQMSSVLVAEGGDPSVRLSLFWSVQRWCNLTIFITFLQSFGQIHETCFEVFWVNHFLHFMQIWVIIERLGGNVFSWDTFSGSHLISKARHIYIWLHSMLAKVSIFKISKNLIF